MWLQSQWLAPTAYLPIGARSGNPKSWVSKPSQDCVYFFQTNILHQKKKKRGVYSQQKCVNYLRKTNVRDDLCSKNKCLAHVFVPAKNVIAVLLCAG